MQFIYGSVKNDVYKKFAWQRNGWYWKSAIRTLLKLWHCQIIWDLFAGFKTIILYSFHCILIAKYIFTAKVCFVKTVARIVKYESWVAKSIPDNTKNKLNIYLCRKSVKYATKKGDRKTTTVTHSTYHHVFHIGM